MLRRAGLFLCGMLSMGCGRAPCPLYPVFQGSIGMPHRGVLTAAVELPAEGPGYRFLRDNDRHYATARFAEVLTRAAAKVEEERPGAVLVMGDLSRESGGRLLPHFSHRNGRDADLLLYTTTLDGAPVASPGFVHFGPDGLAYDKVGKRFLRFDAPRQWLLVKTLLEDPDAHIQWIFVHLHIRARLIQWARASGEDEELIARAFEVMGQPRPGGPHDDHLHVRTACTAEELFHGCEHSGPVRAWLIPKPLKDAPTTLDAELIADLTR